MFSYFYFITTDVSTNVSLKMLLEDKLTADVRTSIDQIFFLLWFLFMYFFTRHPIEYFKDEDKNIASNYKNILLSDSKPGSGMVSHTYLLKATFQRFTVIQHTGLNSRLSKTNRINPII